MTVTASYSPLYTAGDGVTTSFAASWPVFASTDIKVDVYDTSLGSLVSPAPVLNGGGTYDYTVTLGSQDTNTGEYASATVVLNTAVSSRYRVIRRRQVAAQQPSQFRNNELFPAPAVEQFGDRLAMALQQSNSDASLFSIRIPFTDGLNASVTLPSAELRADTLMAFDGAGGVTTIPTTSQSATSAQAAASVAAAAAVTAQAAASLAVASVGAVKVSANDATPGDIEAKLLVASTGSLLSLSTQNDGGNETRTVTLAATVISSAATASLTAGYIAGSYDAGTKSSGTFTPDPTQRNIQHYTNGGAHTLAPPSSSCSMVIDMTNNGSAGAVTTSGFTKVTGDTLTTTNGHKFRFYITVGNGGSHLHKQALQ